VYDKGIPTRYSQHPCKCSTCCPHLLHMSQMFPTLPAYDPGVPHAPCIRSRCCKASGGVSCYFAFLPSCCIARILPKIL
jgi:hypothetical protein